MNARSLLRMLGAAAFGVALVVGPANGATPAPGTSNGTVTFTVANKNGTTGNVTICLSVEKPGKNSLVCGTPTGTEVSGKHTFPAGTQPATIVAYYDGLLQNSGWASPADYKSGGPGINFYGITKLDKSSSNGNVTVSATIGDKTVAYAGSPHVTAMMLTRGATRQDGMITLVGFGMSWDTTHQSVTPSTSTITVHFTATDSASDIMQAIASELTAAGWTASIDADGWLEISKNASGDSIYTLWDSVEEYQGDGTNDDDWTFVVLQ